MAGAVWVVSIGRLCAAPGRLELQQALSISPPTTGNRFCLRLLPQCSKSLLVNQTDADAVTARCCSSVRTVIGNQILPRPLPSSDPARVRPRGPGLLKTTVPGQILAHKHGHQRLETAGGIRQAQFVVGTFAVQQVVGLSYPARSH